MSRRQVVPDHMRPLVDGVSYSPGVVVDGTLLVSGQVGRDHDLVPVDGLEAQIRAAFENLRAVVEEAGGSLDDVVELTTYHVDLPGQLTTFVAVKQEYFGDADRLPAWTAVGVVSLTRPELVVEIQARAQLAD